MAGAEAIRSFVRWLSGQQLVPISQHNTHRVKRRTSSLTHSNMIKNRTGLLLHGGWVGGYKVIYAKL